jgi:hypothetical protein
MRNERSAGEKWENAGRGAEMRVNDAMRRVTKREWRGSKEWSERGEGCGRRGGVGEREVR